jgi:hypothetical protein
VARIRSIKPEFWLHELLSETPPEVHMLAAALLNYSDDEGFFNANPGLVKAACCPLRDDSTSIPRALEILESIEYIEVRQGSDGRRFGRVIKFKDHQRVDKPSPSKIKHLFESAESSGTTRGLFHEHSTTEQGTGNREQGTGNGEHEFDHVPAKSPARPRSAEWFETWWQAYPAHRRKAKKLCIEIWKRHNLDKLGSDLVADVERRINHDNDWRRGFIPLPKTYLNQRRWEDVVVPVGNGTEPAPATNEGWIDLGRRLGMEPRAGETWPDFIGRVKSKWRTTDG